MSGSINLALTPDSYWPERDARRPEVSDGANRPGVAPGFGDGAYLPEPAEGEVDIAEVCLESTTGDVFTVRARQTELGIAYSVADEYEGVWDVGEPVRPGPLSMRELIDLIDTAESSEGITGLVDGYLEMNLEEVEPDDLRGFVSVTSAYYPQLGRYYDARVEERLDEEEALRGPADDDEDEEEEDDDDAQSPAGSGGAA